jgi:hypothetical protein
VGRNDGRLGTIAAGEGVLHLVDRRPSDRVVAGRECRCRHLGHPEPDPLFAPGSRIIIIECADPDGSSANLPTSLSSCDEDTVEADTVLVQPNGSFTEHTFTLYSLPNSILGEGPTWQPVCNQTHQCVLYIGENQDDFTQPKIFSQPFAITPAASTSTSAPTASASSGSSTSAISAGVSLTPSTLAFTGADPLMPWLVAIGLCLTMSGIVGQRVWRRRRS